MGTRKLSARPLLLVGAAIVLLAGAGFALNIPERIIRIEKQTRTDACVDQSSGRACRELLNRLLTTATPAQRDEIRAGQEQRTETLSGPRVTPPRRKPAAPPDRGGAPTDERPPVSTNPPKSPSAPPQSDVESPGAPVPPAPAPEPQPAPKGPLSPLCDFTGLALPLC